MSQIKIPHLPIDDPPAALTALYGQISADSGGIVHVASVWRAPGGDYITLRVGPHAPVSEIDWFVLNAARARADAIVTTGRILRAEPELIHDLRGSMGAALTSWRARALERSRPPYLLILTSGRDVPRAHPALRGCARPVIYTGVEGADALESAGDLGVPIIRDERPSLARALVYLRAHLGCRTVVVEAGPSTSAALYGGSGQRGDRLAQVDELLLSIYQGERLSPSSHGPTFVSAAAIDATLPHRSPGFQAGRWRFMRFTRASAQPERSLEDK